LLILALILGACTAVPPLPAASPAPATATAVAPAATPPAATAAPIAAPPTPATDSLVQLVQAGLPAGAFEGVVARPLAVRTGWPPLWAVHTYGLRNFDLDPLQNHFVAVYTQAEGKWQELARQEFSSDDQTAAAPDYVAADGLVQAPIEPSHVWLALEGGAGAHSGTFNLLAFDGQTLRLQVNGFSSSPGAGRIEDVNGDGAPDVILDASDYYVFCYACGVVDVGFRVFAWDQASGRMVERQIEPMTEPGHPARDLTNEAVALADAGLWKDAASAIAQARQAAADVQPASANDTVAWDYGLIRLHTGALAAGAANSGYPLLSNVFYGDYAAAVDLMRPYSAAEIFNTQGPLIVGTVAEGGLSALYDAITRQADAALALKPDLAPANFLRGWASYLADPAANLAQARADVEKAAALAPDDTLFRDAAAFLTGAAD
jgi:hypothetical protein